MRRNSAPSLPALLARSPSGPQTGSGYTWWQVNFDSGADGYYLTSATLAAASIDTQLMLTFNPRHRTISTTTAHTVACTSAYQPDTPPLCKAAITGRLRQSHISYAVLDRHQSLRKPSPAGMEAREADGQTGIQ